MQKALVAGNSSNFFALAERRIGKLYVGMGPAGELLHCHLTCRYSADRLPGTSSPSTKAII